MYSDTAKFENALYKAKSVFEEDADFKKFAYDSAPKPEHGSVEVSSNPLSNVSEFDEFYSFTERFTAKCGALTGTELLSHTENSSFHIEGGGEHIHVDFTNLEHRSACIVDALFRNPAIHWFMADWCDDDSSPRSCMENLLSKGVTGFNASTVALVLKNHLHTWGHTPVQFRSDTRQIESGKSSYSTVEFRFPASSVDKQHMIDNVELALALVSIQYYYPCSDISTGPMNYLTSHKKYSKLPEERHIEDFRAFIRNAFDRNRADHFVEKYIHQYRMRRAHGRM